MTIDAWIFDLDGTLIDSWPGIVGAMGHACAKMGTAPVAESTLLATVGKPLPAWCADLFGEERAEEATRIYREYYADRGWTEYVAYPGIEEMLRQAKRRFVGTSKMQRFAEQMVAREGWTFDAIYGVTYGERDDKTAMLGRIVAENGLDPARTAMVGDLPSDIRAASANGLVGVGVAYGFGTREALEHAGAAWVAETADEIIR